MKNINTIISTGQGRLHLIESARALKNVGISTKVITGWIPSPLFPDKLINFLGSLLGRKNLASGLRKRNLDDFDAKDVVSCSQAELTMNFLFLLTKFKVISKESATVFGWKTFGKLSKKHINAIDIFHVRSGAGQGGAIEKAKHQGIKVVVDHSIAHPNEVYNQILKANNGIDNNISISPKSKFWQLILKDCEAADMLQVNSEYVKKSFVNEGFQAEKIKVIPLGIRPAFWNIKTEYTKSKTLKLLFTGGFGKRKGAHLIVDTCEILLKKNISFSIDIIGSIINDFDIPEWFSNHPKINLHGYLPQEELFAYLANSDIYIFPSYSEGAAQSLKEAMAAGMPVIATEQSGAPLSHLENGWVIEDHSSEALLNAIISLKDDFDLQKKLGQNAAATIKQYHTWEAYGNSVNELYKTLLSK